MYCLCIFGVLLISPRNQLNGQPLSLLTYEELSSIAAAFYGILDVSHGLSYVCHYTLNARHL